MQHITGEKTVLFYIFYLTLSVIDTSSPEPMDPLGPAATVPRVHNTSKGHENRLISSEAKKD